jgi:transcriptional regulator with XRE-family HTH domain
MPTAKKAVSKPGAEQRAEAGLAERMLALRTSRGLSLNQLADRCGLTKSFLSKVERKAAVPSITTAIKVSKALGVRVSHLLGEADDDSAILVVRKNAGDSFVTGTAGVRNTHQALAAGRSVKKMEPFLLRPSQSYDPSVYDSDRLFSVAGEHFCFVLSGVIEIEFQDRIVRLNEGDSIYFNSDLIHKTRSAGETQGELLVIVAPA